MADRLNDTPKPRKNIEKRREKSRCAARSRRAKEGDIYDDLLELVPFRVKEAKTSSHVDRIATLRLALAQCRLAHVAPLVFGGDSFIQPVDRSVNVEHHNDDILFSTDGQDVLDGFTVLVDSDEVILYISSSVALYLGLAQTDLVGQVFSDYLHTDDQDEWRKIKAVDNEQDFAQVLLRLKSVITHRGRCLNYKSATYKVVAFNISCMRCCTKKNIDKESKLAVPSKTTVKNDFVYLMHGLPVLHPASVDLASSDSLLSIPSSLLTSRHTADWKFTFCHDRLADLLGYGLKELLSTSLFRYIHPDDLQLFCNDMKNLDKKGQALSGRYRLLTRSGGQLRCHTDASTVSHNSKAHKGHYIALIHQIFGSDRTNTNGYSTPVSTAGRKQVGVCHPVDRNNENSFKPTVTSSDVVSPYIFTSATTTTKYHQGNHVISTPSTRVVKPMAVVVPSSHVVTDATDSLDCAMNNLFRPYNNQPSSVVGFRKREAAGIVAVPSCNGKRVCNNLDTTASKSPSVYECPVVISMSNGATSKLSLASTCCRINQHAAEYVDVQPDLFNRFDDEYFNSNKLYDSKCISAISGCNSIENSPCSNATTVIDDVSIVSACEIDDFVGIGPAGIEHRDRSSESTISTTQTTQSLIDDDIKKTGPNQLSYMAPFVACDEIFELDIPADFDCGLSANAVSTKLEPGTVFGSNVSQIVISMPDTDSDDDIKKVHLSKSEEALKNMPDNEVEILANELFMETLLNNWDRTNIDVGSCTNGERATFF